MNGLLRFLKEVLHWVLFAGLVFGANLAANYMPFEAEVQTSTYTYCFTFPDRSIRCKTMTEWDDENQPTAPPQTPQRILPPRRNRQEPLEI